VRSPYTVAPASLFPVPLSVPTILNSFNENSTREEICILLCVLLLCGSSCSNEPTEWRLGVHRSGRAICQSMTLLAGSVILPGHFGNHISDQKRTELRGSVMKSPHRNWEVRDRGRSLIVRDYSRGVRGHEMNAIAQRRSLPRAMVRSLIR